MGDAIHSFLADYEHGQDDAGYHPAQHQQQPARANCCCGNAACAFLKHNQTALDGLEKDVSTAARLGKALLMRHETYIADSERERKAMTVQIETLEMEKETLEKKNAATIEENRSLLDQLESFNNAVAESDAHIISLQATLHSTQQELQKLQGFASRTSRLEQQILEFEQEQAAWHSSLESKEESERSAVRRWQKAERTLADLQEEIERIEREASEEKQRHIEIVERMERRHEVERELGSAAGRLKGAAALKANGHEPSPNVVSHFVKDILQDNANLQLGIVELREMLTSSNEEVEKLRDQLSLHQPADDDSEALPQQPQPQQPSRRNDLRAELTRSNSSEVHVHHHYHAPKPLRRKKKALGSGYHTPSSSIGTPRSSYSHTPRSSFSQALPTPAATILQQTMASVPQAIPDRKRWSTQSNQTYTSLASSPQSMTNRSSSIFERVFSDAGIDSSRPTTPDTEDYGSPVLGPSSHLRKPSAGSFRTFSAPVVQRRGLSPTGAGRHTLDAIISVEELPKLDLQNANQDTIPEESENDWENASSSQFPDESAAGDTGMTSPNITEDQDDEETQKLHFDPSAYHHPSLRRTTSHDSVFSVAAMDIHTLKSRPSQLLGPSYRDRGRGITSQAVISDTTAHATPPAILSSSRTAVDSRNLLSGMATEARPQLQTAASTGSSRPTLGRKVGGWVFGKWGGASPTSTTIPEGVVVPAPMKKGKAPSVSSASIKSGEDSVTASSQQQQQQNKFKLRSPGVNQAGPILGLRPEIKVQHAPVVKGLDEDALRKALGNG